MSNRNPSTNIILIKRLFVLLFVTASLAMLGLGCNTAHGFGQDMQNAGQSIQDGTK